MAATAQWYEDNGQATGSPRKGSTRSLSSRGDFKSVDDTSTPYGNARIIAGQNSFHKYRFVKFSGSFNQLSNAKFAHTSGSLTSGVNIVGKVTSQYDTPSRSDLGGATDISSVTNIDSGMPVLFSAVGPEGSASQTLSAPGYSQYCVTQLKTSSSAQPGDISEQIFTLQWDEN